MVFFAALEASQYPVASFATDDSSRVFGASASGTGKKLDHELGIKTTFPETINLNPSHEEASNEEARENLIEVNRNGNLIQSAIQKLLCHEHCDTDFDDVVFDNSYELPDRIVIDIFNGN